MKAPTTLRALVLQFDPNRPRASKTARAASNPSRVAKQVAPSRSLAEKVQAVLTLPQPSAHLAIEVLVDRLLWKYEGRDDTGFRWSW